MKWIDYVKGAARENKKSILLPEGYDERIIKAAKAIEMEQIADITVVSEEAIEGVNTIRPQSGTLSEAAQLVSEGAYDGMVAGAVNSTAQVIRSALKKIGARKDVSVVSSFFLMDSDNEYLGEKGAFLFADCAVNIAPDHVKLADIAVSTAQSARDIMGWEPRVAFLSFSTKGSASHASVDAVRKTVEELKKRNADFVFDGELQLDAAVIPEVAMKKDPEGLLKGTANILVFPDLNSANIAYKTAQRLGGFRAVGPILQGYNRPVNDLSRGCSVEDIIDVVAFTALQAVKDQKK